MTIRIKTGHSSFKRLPRVTVLGRVLATTKIVVFAVPYIRDVREAILFFGIEVIPSLGHRPIKITIMRATSFLVPTYRHAAYIRNHISSMDLIASTDLAHP
jgi:hypothetical protein